MLTAAWLIMADRTKQKQTIADQQELRGKLFALDEILHSYHKACGERLASAWENVHNI